MGIEKGVTDMRAIRRILQDLRRSIYLFEQDPREANRTEYITLLLLGDRKPSSPAVDQPPGFGWLEEIYRALESIDAVLMETRNPIEDRERNILPSLPALAAAKEREGSP